MAPIPLCKSHTVRLLHHPTCHKEEKAWNKWHASALGDDKPDQKVQRALMWLVVELNKSFGLVIASKQSQARSGKGCSRARAFNLVESMRGKRLHKRLDLVCFPCTTLRFR